MNVQTKTLTLLKPPTMPQYAFFNDDTAGYRMSGEDWREMGKPETIVIQVSVPGESQ